MTTPAFKSPSTYLVAAAVLAMCSLSYELVFAQIVAEITGNPTIWESLSMAVFLGGMGVRSLLFKNDNATGLGERLVSTEISLIGGALLSYFAVFVLQMLYRMYVFDAGTTRELWSFPPVFLLGAASQGALFLLGWLTAFELQFFLHYPKAPEFRFKESAVLAAYHFGALLGTLAFVVTRRTGGDPFLLLAGTAIINFIFALYVTQLLGLWRKFGRALGLVTVLLALSLLAEGGFKQLILKNQHYNLFLWKFDAHGLKDVQHPLGPFAFIKAAPDLPDVRRLRSPFQVLDMVDDLDTKSSSLFINGRFQVGSGSAERYHETFAHVSLGYKVMPARRTLILGGGDGVLARELLKHQSIETIDLVEIDATVLTLANHDPDLQKLNLGSLKDPRVAVHQEDAMAFIRQRQAAYDAIFIDLTYPYDFDSARFFSVEFFRMVNRDLLPGGILVAGLPLDLSDPENHLFGKTVDSTLAAAGFKTYVAYSNGNDHFFVLGKTQLLPTWKLKEGLVLSELPNLKVKTSTVIHPIAGEGVLTVMRPRLLMTYDTFF